MFRIGLGIIAALGLTACTERDVVLNTTYITDFGLYQDNFGTGLYVDPTGDTAAEAQWADARSLTVTVRQNEFSPMMVRLKRDVPYSLTVVNRDRDAISFKASDFFQNVSVSSLSATVSGDKTLEELEKPVLVSFVVPANSERTVTFVPIMEGRYDFEDGKPGLLLPTVHFAPFSRGNMSGSFGVFVVE